jgi:hypothetical protein
MKLGLIAQAIASMAPVALAYPASRSTNRSMVHAPKAADCRM